MPRIMTIGQALAQEKTARQRANEQRAKLAKALANQSRFSGLIKTYEPYREGDDVFQAPQQITHVQIRVEPDIIHALTEALAPALNLTASKEWGNQKAVADLEVDGSVLYGGVPATYLLFLEHQFQELDAVVNAMPVLDSAERWEPDTTTGVWRTTEADKTVREEKEEVPSIGHPGTEHHPPQVRWITRSVPTGVYSTVKFSGAIEPRRKEEFQRRLHALKQAVHLARERANQTEAPVIDIGNDILAYLFG